ncbi:V-type ATP synthase subunit I [Enterococcus villorum]|uniref:V-type ATP synthase subunit I n=1 Tax=Enterococcus villorum TaxID=112904 RepID=A0A1V8YC64_9ENTE|nr:V-type ATP synthase subunit I [Enterococcus villorum]OQO70198.1 V-type ATP synthase subunit I [Enterococcus villorum]OQO76928.1 V-type ATP synthase subunit I [Enterococcus villorum]
MAVTKMEKVTLISDKKNQELLLQALQGIHAVEIRDLFQEFESNEWVDFYFPEKMTIDKEKSISNLSHRLKEIRTAIQFIEHHGDKTQKKSHLKRRELSLQELEKNYSEENFLEKLNEVLSLKEQWEQLVEQRQQLEEEEMRLINWQNLDVSPNNFDSQTTSLIIGTVNAKNAEAFKEEITKIKEIYLEEINASQTTVYFAFIVLRSDEPRVAEIINRYGFIKEDYLYENTPRQQLEVIKENLEVIKKQQKQLSSSLGSCSGYIQEFEWTEEIFLARSEREIIKDRLIHTPYLILIQGWVDREEKQVLTQIIQNVLSVEDVYITFEEPTDKEMAEEVPTKLKNHPIVAPFEMLTEMYSLPKYNEVDPTPWMTPFYLVFFGMMVADIGYGLLMFLGAFLVQKLIVLPREMQRFAKFFEILAVPSIIWGFIYSSFFGMALPKEILGVRLPFPLLSTTDDVNTILILSVIFGLIQILVGLFIAAKEQIKRKAYIAAVNDGFAWQGILIGIILVLLGTMLIKNQAFVYLGGGLAVISALCILMIPIFQSSSKAKGMAKGAYNLYGLTGYIGDLVSYTRLMALGISGGSIAAAFNMLVAFMPPVARFSVGLLLIVALHALNMFLTLLSAYVHGARLQYVEFFGKFYSGGGRAFNPLKTVEKYVNINHKKK